MNAPRYAQPGNDFAKHSAVDRARDEYGYRELKTGVNIRVLLR
jgi:hypothetical protein